jgi:hypothetical protein
MSEPRIETHETHAAETTEGAIGHGRHRGRASADTEAPHPAGAAAVHAGRGRHRRPTEPQGERSEG